MTLREMKSRIEKEFGGTVVIEKAMISNSIYIDLVDSKNSIHFYGRISDHAKSFQHEGDVSVVYKNKITVTSFKKIQGELIEEFYSKATEFLKENKIQLEKKVVKKTLMSKFENGEKLTLDELYTVYKKLNLEINYVEFLKKNGR